MNDPETIQCACGCGTVIPRLGSKGRVRRFAYRHYANPQVLTIWRSLSMPEAKEQGPCWEWPTARNPRGYGLTKRNGENYAHRAAWTEVNGPIPGDLHVLHRCDNPPCVRPSHLFLGTPLDNSQDMWSKGRGPKPSAPPPIDVEFVVRMYLAGASTREIRSTVHTSRERLNAILIENGVALRPPSSRAALKVTCGAGHLLAGDNLYLHQGNRHCRRCRADRYQRSLGRPVDSDLAGMS